MKTSVKLLNQSGKYEWMEIDYSERPPWSMRIASVVTGKQTIEADDLFECLVAVRRLVEPLGWRVLCNGSRIDAFASNMSREGSGGDLLTLLSIRGRPQTMDDLVFIFDEAPSNAVGTVAEQAEYVNRFFGATR